jgi:hypothetical protein
MILSTLLNMSALAMFIIGLVFVSVPFAVGGAGLALLAAVSKGITNE